MFVTTMSKIVFFSSFFSSTTAATATVGAGGTGGTAPSGLGSAGGDSSFGALMTWLGAPVAANLVTGWYNLYDVFSLDFNYQYNSPLPGNGAANGSSVNVQQYGFAGYIGKVGTAGT